MEMPSERQEVEAGTEPTSTMKIEFELEPAHESAKKMYPYFQLENWTGIASKVNTYLASVGIKGEVRAMIRPIIPTKEEYEPYIVVCVDRVSVDESGVVGLAEEVRIQLDEAGFNDPEYKLWIAEKNDPPKDLVVSKIDNDRTSVLKVDGPRSVKHLTCWYWKNSDSGCHKSAKDCLYAHEDTGRDVERPRALVPGGRAVAGKNASRVQAELNSNQATQISVLDKTKNTDSHDRTTRNPVSPSIPSGGRVDLASFPQGFVHAGLPNVQSLNVSHAPSTLPFPAFNDELAHAFNRDLGQDSMVAYQNAMAQANAWRLVMGGGAPSQSFHQSVPPGFQQVLPGFPGFPQSLHQLYPQGLPPGFPQGPPPGYPQGLQQSIQQAFPNLPGLAEIVHQGLQQGQGGTMMPLNDGRLVSYNRLVSGNLGLYTSGLANIPGFAPSHATNNVAFNGVVGGDHPGYNPYVAAFNNDRGSHLYMSAHAGQGIPLNASFAPNSASNVYTSHRVSNQAVNSGHLGHTRARGHLTPEATNFMTGLGGNAAVFNSRFDGTDRRDYPIGRTVLDAGAGVIDNAQRNETVVVESQRGRSFLNTEARGPAEVQSGITDVNNNISTEFIASSTNVNNNNTSTTLPPLNTTLDPELAFTPPPEDEGIIIEEPTTSQSIPIMFNRRGHQPTPLNLNREEVGMANLNLSDDPEDIDHDKMTMQVYQQLTNAGMDTNTHVSRASLSTGTSGFNTGGHNPTHMTYAARSGYNTGDHNATQPNYATQIGLARGGLNRGGLNLGGSNTISAGGNGLVPGGLNFTYGNEGDINTDGLNYTYGTESGLNSDGLNYTYGTRSGANSGGFDRGGNNTITAGQTRSDLGGYYAASANRTNLGRPMVSPVEAFVIHGPPSHHLSDSRGFSNMHNTGNRFNLGLDGAASESLGGGGSTTRGSPGSILDTAQSTPTRAPRFRIRGSNFRRSDHGTQASPSILYTNVNTLKAGRNLHEGLQGTLKHLNGVEARLVNILASARETFVSQDPAEYAQTIYEINKLRDDTKAAVTAAEARIAEAKDSITLNGDRSGIFGDGQDEAETEDDTADGGVSVIV